MDIFIEKWFGNKFMIRISWNPLTPTYISYSLRRNKLEKPLGKSSAQEQDLKVEKASNFCSFSSLL